VARVPLAAAPARVRSPWIRVSLHNDALDLGHTAVVHSGHDAGGDLRDAHSDGLALGGHQHHLRAPQASAQCALALRAPSLHRPCTGGGCEGRQRASTRECAQERAPARGYCTQPGPGSAELRAPQAEAQHAGQQQATPATPGLRVRSQAVT